MTDRPTPTSDESDFDRPQSDLDPRIVASLREIAAADRPVVSPEFATRLDELDRAVGSAIDERVEHIEGRRFRFRVAARWVGRAAAIAAATVLGGLVGWQPPTAAPPSGTEPAAGVVVIDGPITILDAFAVARMLAQHGDRTVDLGRLGLSERVSTRLDIDGDGALDSSDLERLIERAVRSGGDR